MKRMVTLKWFLVGLCLVMLGLSGNGQISITSMGTQLTENFDGMGSSATAPLPNGFRVGTDWSSGTSVCTLAYGTSGTGIVTGTSGGGVINWANGVTATSTDRSLGFLNTGTFTSPKSIVLKITNNSTSTIATLALSFDYEKSRSGSRQFDWTFFHGNTIAPTIAAAAGNQSYPADANNTVISNPPITTNKTFSLTGLSIAPNTDYYLKWTFTGLAGSTNGQGISIDNFSITPTAAISSDATLSSLTLSAGALSPAFTSTNLNYTASVANSISSITVTPTHTDAHATITVNGTTVTSGSASTSINLAEGDNTITTVVTAEDGVTTKTYQVIVTRAAAGVGTLTTSSSLQGFGNVCTNTIAGPNSFTINGTDLTNGGSISIAALAGFTYSETAGGTYSTTLSFSYTGTSFTGKVIYVQFNPTAVQSYDGNIVLSGGGVAGYNIPVTGSGINTPTTVTATAATAVTATTASIGGSLGASGCSVISSYGIKYNATSSFDPTTTTGTTITANNLSAGNFSVVINGLDPNKQYYYYAFTISSGITTYSSAALSFITGPLPVAMASQPGLSFTEKFDDIADWGNFFISPTPTSGANHFDGLSSTATAGSGLGIPKPTVLTASTNSFQPGDPGTAGGVQKGTDQNPAIANPKSIVLLVTGTTDNQTSAAIDFYMDFTGLNAGTLSFDWASINNVSGNRNASLKVYTSTDGIAFDSLPNASVTNFTNFSPTNDTKANVPLPASFNNSATARLRFYVYNGTGGTTGSRPKIGIDNLTVTAVATTPCASPTAPATNLVFGAVTDVSIAGSFTAASPTSDNYIIVASTNSSLTKNPDDGQIYNLGDNLGDGTVVAKGSSTSFTATGLSASTLYYFFVFPVNSICTGGPLYYSNTILTGQATTNAGLPTCAAPAAQPTAYTATATGTNTLSGSFTATTADEYLILVSSSASFTGTLTNGQLYSNGDVVGNAKVVQRSNLTSFTATGLSPNTPYYFYIFSSNTQACVNGPAYNTTSPLTSGAQTTNPLPACSIPSIQPTQLTFNASNKAISGAFTPASGVDDYLVVMSTTQINPTPINGTDYNVGDNLGGGIVVANSSSTSFVTANLTTGTQYYFYVFSANKNCSGGTKYFSTNPLTNNTTTNNVLANNYYFGNIHSHSDYSDGNKDHPGYTPADDYAYAKTAQCMDFLGISEHNHYSSGDPGNTVTNYHLGTAQANTFTANNPGFLAMYGMEWGVISGGGHVVVYGDGMDKLFGWESGSGGWGATDNYDVFVPKSTYTSSVGLFKTVNDNVATNTFATLAHPNFTDYNNIANIAYDAVADSAITGTAVESGPATSTNQTYSNPSSVTTSYSTYFQTLLAKGYHLGPTIDHDNHNTTFGHTTYSRTAVVAPALTKTEVIKAYHNMHFYATEDCDSKVDFTINTKIMGSVFTDRYAPNISVTLTDATTVTTSAVIKIMYGVPGSGILAAKIDSVIGNKLTFSDNSLANLATGYYYADITNGTARIITSPIWYTRNDATTGVILPVTLSSFLAQKANAAVNLTWTTEQEINSNYFVVERSADGNNWTNIGSQTAAGNSTSQINYVFNDNNPLSGINYYRLKEVDIDGKFTYSATRSVLFANKFQLSVSPNPAHDFINLYVSNITNETYHIQLTDNNGKLMQKIDTNVQHLSINTSTYAKGVYFVKYVDNNVVTTKKIIIE